jgi:hypothetical protein
MKVVLFTYVFLFVSLFKLHAAQTSKQQPTDCVKQPQIVSKIATKQTEKQKPASVVKNVKVVKPASAIPHFSLFNVINFFYTKDTLDNLHVM